MPGALASHPDGSTLAATVTCGRTAGRRAVRRSGSSRRMRPVLIIAGELVRAARSGPRETWHPAALDGLAYVRAPRVAKASTTE